MATYNKSMHVLATKLGISDEEKVLNKAAEYERLLHTKSTAGSNITDTSKTVICLDLAAGVLGADLDMKTAIKYSGLKPTTYSNCRKMVQNLLELNEDKLTTLIVCNAFQCNMVQELADRILAEYQQQAKLELDLSLPQYVCMAVFQACRISKVKISKSKIAEKGRLKPAQWSKLDADWTKFVEQNFATAKKKRGRPTKKTEVLNGSTEENMEIDIPNKIEETLEPKIEPYEDWKKRILEAAYKELKLLKEEQSFKMSVSQDKTPWRSPRKTPQKFSPYKSPVKKAGVRLLFPVDL